MYEFWYDYVKPKYDEKAKLCYMDTLYIFISWYTLFHCIYLNRWYLQRYCKRCWNNKEDDKNKKVIGLMMN